MRQIMQWMNDLTIAVIEEDALRIGELVKSVPDFQDIETAQNALALIARSIEIVERQKKETYAMMQKIKQTKAFLLADEEAKDGFVV